MTYESLSSRRRALAASDAAQHSFLKEPPLHVLVNRWLGAGWEVETAILEDAAQARMAERLSLKDPLPDWKIAALVRSISNTKKRRYARWLWKICTTEVPEQLERTLDSMFMGAHYVELMDSAELLDALADVVRWRMHYNDFEPDESYPWA